MIFAVVSGIQGAYAFQIHNSSISVAGGDSHAHTHTYVHHGTAARDLQTILDAISNFRKIQQDTLAKATPGTIVWPFDCREFWLFVDLDGVLKLMWGSGIPSAGKTVLASIVIYRLEALAREWSYQISVAYVYIRDSDRDDQLTVRGILEVFVKQTIERHPDCMPLAQKAYDGHLREGTQPTEGDLLLLLAGFVARRRATFYILDALDEAPVKIRLALIQKLTSFSMFLHASFQLDALQNCFTVHDVIHTLEAFPQSIKDVYQQTWKRIIQSEPHHASFAKAAFVWVLNAKQPLTIDQMRRALQHPPIPVALSR
ncbi:hypothetical protein BKA70DRAFT_1115287 [Coprinopsis sp. MPI-PUGE-AT-0042]|nr:hypothetical protein BKA70DRAFT_1115287 [Coprinopsis sp. MPI-PUGE-AT-0042]